MEITKCNLCKCSNSKVLYNLTDLLLERDEVLTTFVQCRRCGLIYQNPRPTREGIGNHYPPEYDSYNNELDHKDVSWLYNKAFRYGLYKRHHFVTRHRSHGKLLDIGCATGQFLHAMGRIRGYELTGVEINDYAAKIAREKYGLDVFTGTLEQANYPNDCFDVVTLWDVLEHMHDPASSLCEIYRILKPGGCLILRVPNGKSWDAKLFGKYWFGLDAPRHLYVFTTSTLEALLRKTGFQAQEQNTSIGNYTSIVLNLRFWLVAKGVNQNTRNLILKVISDPISRMLLAPIFFISGLGLKGSLLTVAAAKRNDNIC